VAVLALTVWLGDARPAAAAWYCEDYHAQACAPNPIGAQFKCTWANGDAGGCTCSLLPGMSTAKWLCF